MTDDVEVYVDDVAGEPVLAGILRPSFAGGRTLASSSFQYVPGYLAEAARYALSPELPLVSGRSYAPEDRVLFGVFADAAPDEWGEKIIEANHAVRIARDPSLSRRLSRFDFLLGVSDRTRMGSLRFRHAGNHDWLAVDDGVATVHELSRVLDVASRYERNQASDDDLAYLSDIATSPGGARPKANVVLGDGQLALAKLPHSKDGDFDVEGWEAVALTIAFRAGITVPRFERHRAGASTSVLVSYRFDRDDAGGRRGYISGATALELGDRDSRGTSYEDFAETIAELSHDPAADLREMFARIALTVLINNVDDHWRNHGFVRTARGWRLAPAFDLNPSRMRGVLSSRRISASDDPRSRDLRSLMAGASTYALTGKTAAGILNSVAKQVERWRDVARELRIPDGQTEAMAVAFDAAQLEYALHVGA